ncbi:MAG: GntR family transcriptional regulator [Armatimonadetes bacterium]|nr:GntR family transcriptional regulator [Armatimonadota bacterium]
MIVSGEFQPGDRVPDVVVAEKLGVSRTPVREALATLVAHGLLIKNAHFGCTVVEPSPADLLAVFQVREVNEALAARLMALQGTAEDIATLGEIHRQLMGAASDRDVMAYWRSDFEFHRQILIGSGNRYLAEGPHLTALLLQFFLMAHKYQYGFYQTDAPWWASVSRPEHTAIWEAIRDRDPEAAENLMREHMRRSSDRVQSLLAAQAAGET